MLLPTGQAGVPASVPTAAAVGFPDSSSTNPSIEPANPDLAEALRRSNMYRKRHQVSAEEQQGGHQIGLRQTRAWELLPDST